MYGVRFARGTPWSVYIWVPPYVDHSPISPLDEFGSAIRVFYLINIIIIIIIIYYMIFS
jgi:hypothetical protein